MKLIYPQVRKNEIVLQEIKGELLIYDLRLNKAFCLNETSGLVWQSCDGKHSVAEITRAVEKRFKTPVAEDLIWLAIEQFREENLLGNNQPMTGIFNGLSRREAIRKIGLTAMIALPVINSLIAPTAAQAQSLTCISFNRSCTSSAECCAAAPNCNATRCCVGSGSLQPTFFYFVDAGQCSAEANSFCCSGNGYFVNNFAGITDRCQCT